MYYYLSCWACKQPYSQGCLTADTSDSEANSESPENGETDDEDINEGSGHSDSDGEGETETMDHTDTVTTDKPSLHPAVSSGDFGKVVQLKAQRELSNREKFYLLKHHFVPSKGYSFPARIFSHR